MKMRVDFFKYTDKGGRNENQDSLDVRLINNSILIACIADGVGGANCGQVASEISVKEFHNKLNMGTGNMKEILLQIHNDLKSYQIENSNCKGMATTFTGCVLKGGVLEGVHIGDSRLCILRGNGIRQLTENHTEVNRLLKEGKISKEDVEFYPRKNVLESAIGAQRQPRIQNFIFRLMLNDRILLTTDGVHEIITKVEFRDKSINNPSIKDFGNSIIDTLKSRKLTDNVSFIILSVN